VSRPLRLTTIVLGVVVFLTISVGLGRFLTTENAERDAVLGLLGAQARGDESAVVSRLSGCRAAPSCLAAVHANVTRLRRAGDVKILSLSSNTAYALASETGRTRVAWEVAGRLPVVQCVLVRRHGNAVSGLSISLLALSPPIPNTGDC
jgi:hypothetical protein